MIEVLESRRVMSDDPLGNPSTMTGGTTGTGGSTTYTAPTNSTGGSSTDSGSTTGGNQTTGNQTGGNNGTGTGVTADPPTQAEIDTLFDAIDQGATDAHNAYLALKAALADKIHGAQDQFGQSIDASADRLNAGLTAAATATQAAFGSWMATSTTRRVTTRTMFDGNEATRKARRLSEDAATEADHTAAVDAAINAYDAEVGATQADYDAAETAAQAAFETALASTQAAYDSAAASLWAAYQSITNAADTAYTATTSAAETAYTAAETGATSMLQSTSTAIDATLQSSLSAAQSAREASLSGSGSTGYDTSFISDPAYQDASSALIAAAQSSIDSAVTGLESAVTAATAARNAATAAATTTRQDDIASQLATHTSSVDSAKATRDTAVAAADAALSATRASLATAYDSALSGAETNLQDALNTALGDYQNDINAALAVYDTAVRTANDDYDSWATTRFGEDPTYDPVTGDLIPSSGGTYKTDADALIETARQAIIDGKGPYETAIADAETDRAETVNTAITDYINLMLPKSWENPQYTAIWRTADTELTEAFNVFQNLGDQAMLKRRLVPIHDKFMQGWIKDEQKLVEDGLKAKEDLINALIGAEMQELRDKSDASLTYAGIVSGAITTMTTSLIDLEAGAATDASSRSAAVDNATSSAEQVYISAKATAQKAYDDAVSTARKAFRDTVAAAQKARAEGETAAIDDRTLAIDAAEEACTNEIDAADSTWVADNSASVQTYQDALQSAAETWDSAVTSAEDSAWSQIEGAVNGYVSAANGLFESAMIAANPSVPNIGDIAAAMTSYNSDVADALLSAGADSIDAIHTFNDTLADAADAYSDTMLTAGITLASSYSSAASTYVTTEAGAWRQASDDAANAIEQRVLSAIDNEKAAFDREANATFNATRAITQATKDRVERLARSARDDAQAATNNAKTKFNSDVADAQSGLTNTLSGIAAALGTEQSLQSANQTDAIAAYKTLMADFVREAKEARIAQTRDSLAEMRRFYKDLLVATLAGSVSSRFDVESVVTPTLSWHSFDPIFGVGELDAFLNPPPETDPDPQLPNTQPPPPPMPSAVAQAFEMGWEAYKGYYVGLGHGIQITTNRMTFGQIAPLNESTEQLINQNAHLGYKYADAFAGSGRDLLITAATLGAGGWAAGAAQCGTWTGRAAQIYNGATTAYAGFQGSRASVEAAKKINQGDYIGATLSVAEASLNFLGAAQAGKLAVKPPNCFRAGTQVVVKGDQPPVLATSGTAAMSDETLAAGATGTVAAVVGAALLAAKTRAEAQEWRITYDLKPRRKKREDEDDDTHGSPEPTLPPPERSEPDTIVVPAPVNVAPQPPRSRWLSKTLTAAMLLCFTIAGWCWSQPLFRPNRFVSASFTANTSVATTEAQFTTKNIEAIEVDDLVLARDEHGREIGWRRVVEVYRRTSDHLRHVTFRDESGREQTLDTTDEHPFLIANPHSATGDQFVNAGHLRLGDKVQSPGGSQQTLIATTRTEHPAGIPVFNFQVEGFHTYFVAQSSDMSPLLVHNSQCPLNLNNNGATSNFGVYEIKINGLIHKVGKADLNRVTQTTGLPTRIHQQVRKLKGIYGNDAVQPSYNSLGQVTTQQAKAAECARLQELFDRTGIVPPGNATSFFPQ